MGLGKNIKNYPNGPHLIVDVTRPKNGCGGCTRYAMKTGVSQQGEWKTKDGSNWWLRDTKYNEPNGDYHANCYLHVYDVNPNNVRFNDGSCGYYSKTYLCQKKFPAGSTTLVNFGWSAHSLGKLNQCQGDCDNDSHCAAGLKCMQRNGKTAVPGCKAGGSGDVKDTDYCYKQVVSCASGSPSNCKVTKLPVKGYSAGDVYRVDNGKSVRRSTEADSCPSGYKIWSPRNKNDWNLVYNALGKNIRNYPNGLHLIVDVTRPKNGCGGCTRYAMKSGVSQQGEWRTRDGSNWWLRDSKYNEPNGDYHANCYLHVYDVNPSNVRFNDGSCGYYSKSYLCQKMMPKGSTTLVDFGVSAHNLGKLNQCQGDCDGDANCAAGLKCFQRNGRTQVPGCKAGGTGDTNNWDYCAKPFPKGSTTLVDLGVSAHLLGKLNQCQGDCDGDANCAAGLKCFQRNGRTAVPGCKAGGKG